MPTYPQKKPIVYRISIRALGPPRSENQIREAVAAALKESLERLQQETGQKPEEAQVAPEGAFVGAATAAIWLLKLLGGALASEGSKRLVGYFLDSLRKRNLDPGEPSVAKTADHETKRESKARANKKANKRQS